MPNSLEILAQLRGIFPHQPLAYLKLAATYCTNNALSLESFVSDGVESHHFPPLSAVRDEELEEFLRLQFQTLKDLLPDAEDGYLEGLFEAHAGTSSMEAVVLDAVVYQSYPKKQVHKKQKVEFDVKLYCELVPDPLGSFSRPNIIMTENMKAEATDYLVKIFGEDKRAKIFSHVKKESGLYLAFKKMREDQGEPNGQLCSEVLKTVQPKTFDEAPDYCQSFEKLFIENEGDILSYLEKKQADEAQLTKRERAFISLQTCNICCEDRVSTKMLKICDDNHKMCIYCVKQHTELKYHQGIFFFPCAFDCKLYLSNSVIRSVWDTSRYSKLLEDRIFSIKKDEISCPSCKFWNDQSKSPEIVCRHCQIKFCTLCKKMAHFPKACHEKENDLCKLVEECMTKELVRVCPGCKASFIKEPACCNRVKCVRCNTCICYVCRKVVRGDSYEHFYGQGTMPSPGLCPLHSDTNTLHVRNVIDSGRKTFEKLKEDNPDVEFLYDPLAKLPVAGKSDAVPNQF